MRLTQYLSKTLELSYHNKDSKNGLDLFRDKPFVCEYGKLKPSSEYCCFNHIIGLPISSNSSSPSPIWQWQYDYIIKNLVEHKYNWVLKATGIGLSEIVLRWILYKSLVNDKWVGGIVPIFTGVNYDLARRLIDRAASMLYQYFPHAKENERTIRVNNVEITAFPGGHMDTARSLTNCRFFFLDEFDFFEEQKNIESGRKIAERQIAKSDPDILIASTPNRPDGPMQQIQQEEPSLYNKVFLPYTVGLGTIYTEKQIKENMKSPSFNQEYNLAYLGGIGNIYNIVDITAATTDKYSLDESIITSTAFPKWGAIDPAFGSSEFGIIVVQWRDGKLEVLYADSISRPLYSDMLKLTRQLVQRFHLCHLYVDSSASGIIHELKHGYGEYIPYERLPKEVTDNWLKSGCREPLVVPVTFSTHGKLMLQHSYQVLSKRLIRIQPSFDKLLIGLRTATSKGEWDYDKTHVSQYTDIIDCYRMVSLCLKAEGSF
jgi:hypothetical protein